MWFGIPDTDLDIVAPNIDNFAIRDLCFMICAFRLPSSTLEKELDHALDAQLTR